MTATLRDLDAEIARARGWRHTTYGWRPSDRVPESEVIAARYGHPAPLDDPPAFSSEWALAGPLVEEAHLSLKRIERNGRWFVEGDFGPAWAEAATPCEAIARAWLAREGSKA